MARPVIALLTDFGVRDHYAGTMKGVAAGICPDVTFIDRALTRTFRRYAIDPTRVAIEGFSDGASESLSLGLTNGDLFTHVIAFSPGVLMPEERRGTLD